MEDAPRQKAKRWCSRGVLAVSCFLLATPALSAQTDLINTASLGSRGAVFETGGLGDAALTGGTGLGDFNGDGVADLFLSGWEAGADRFHDLPLLSLVFGRPGLTGKHLLGGSSESALNFRSEGAVFARHLRAAGDLDGDGLADALLGMPNYTPEGPVPGQAVLLRGAPGLTGDHLVEEIGTGIRATIFYSSGPEYGYVGFDANNVGDFNGDGQPDLAILGYFPWDSAGSRTALFLTFATRDLAARVDVNDFGVRTPGFILHCREGESGQAVARAGDFNGDGLGDFLLMTLPSFGPGFVYLTYGRRDPEPLIDLQDLEPEAFADHGIVTFEGPDNKHNLEFGGDDQAAAIGDVNGDGFDDILIGATYSGVAFPGGAPEANMARIFYGRRDFPPRIHFDDVPAGLSTVIQPFYEGSVGDGFASKVAAAGDVNLDGVPDLLIGAPYATVGGKDRAGEAYVLFGDRDFPREVFLSKSFPGQRILGEETHNVLGWILGSAGDFNADGNPDILVGARAIFNDPSPGRAYVIYDTGSGESPFTVLGMEPASGPQRGGTTITILGSGLRSGVEVLFGEEAARSTQVISPVELRAVTPTVEKAGTVEVTVTRDGESRRVGEPFEYTPNLPEIDLAKPGIRGLRIDGADGAETGHSLAFGDINGDGVDDLLIGSIDVDDAIRVTVVRGGPGLPETLPAFEPAAEVNQVRTDVIPTGYRVRLNIVGDVNGDGLLDFAVADEESLDGTLSRVFLVFGRRDLPDDLLVSDAIVQGQATELIEASLDAMFKDLSFAAVGDLTGDGIDDFAVGLVESVEDFRGWIVFVAGRKTWPEAVDLHQEAFATVLGRSYGFGHEIAIPGDVDGDGFIELLACCEEPPEITRAYLIPLVRPPKGEIAVESFVQDNGGTVIERSKREFAPPLFMHVAAAGDVNADGHPDFLVSDEGGAEDLQGITFVVPGGPSLPQKVLLPTASREAGDGLVRVFGSSIRVQSGRALGPAGDWNGDGFADFLVGEQSTEPFSPGNMFIVLGGKDLPREIHLHRPGRHAVRLAGTQDVTRLDVSTPRARDLNGDGLEDFAFSEMGSKFFPGTPSPGVVHVIYGIPPTVPFIRGDANFDGAVNISDAIFTLSFLFLGGPAPFCDDAADADDSGRLDITDAIRVLNSLFLGTQTLPPPFPEEGQDSTPDPLGCLGF